MAGLHLHRTDDEAWIVLSGTLGFQVDDEREIKMPAGAAIFEEHDSELLE
ncbi:MAG: cupin domain-containing protein [Solirubrobacteraceae bacterium]